MDTLLNYLPVDVADIVRENSDFAPTEWNELKEAVNAWFYDKPSALRRYGHIKNWDVRGITNMCGMFRGTHFCDDDDISRWDVGNVEDMSNMFSGCRNIPDITRWNVSKVGDTESMFRGATDFNQDISGWVCSELEILDNMFHDATSFNQNLDNWAVYDLGHTDTIDVFKGSCMANNAPSWYVEWGGVSDDDY